MLQDLQWDGCRKETDYYEKSYGSRRNSNFRDTQVDIKDNSWSVEAGLRTCQNNSSSIRYGGKVDCQHFFRQIFLGYFSDIVQAFDTLRKNVCGDDYTSLHNPIVLSSVLPAYGMFHSIQILFL